METMDFTNPQALSTETLSIVTKTLTKIYEYGLKIFCCDGGRTINNVTNFIKNYPFGFNNAFLSAYLRFITCNFERNISLRSYDKIIINNKDECIANIKKILQSVVPINNDVLIFTKRLVEYDSGRFKANDVNKICITIIKLFIENNVPISSDVLACAFDDLFVDMVNYLIDFVPLDSKCIECACKYQFFNNLIISRITPFVRVTKKAIDNARYCNPNMVIFLINSGLYRLDD